MVGEMEVIVFVLRVEDFYSSSRSTTTYRL